MSDIYENTVVICINENDEHFLQIGKVENIQNDRDYPIINYIDVKYADGIKTYKYLDMEYNFLIVDGNILTMN